MPDHPTPPEVEQRLAEVRRECEEMQGSITPVWHALRAALVAEGEARKDIEQRALKHADELIAHWRSSLPLNEYGSVLTQGEYETLKGQLAAATREAEQLRAFALYVLDAVRDGHDFDGGDLQDAAAERGLLVPTEVTEPCDPERCACAEYGDFPMTCYRNGPALAPRVDEVAARLAPFWPRTEGKD